MQQRIQALSNAIQNAPKQGDVTHEGAEGDGGVDATAGDIGADGNSHEECESVGYCGGDEAGRGAGATIGKLSEGHAGAFAGENEYQHGDELRHVALMASGLVASAGDPTAILASGILKIV